MQYTFDSERYEKGIESTMIATFTPLPSTPSSRPFGTAYLPETGDGVDLVPHGYIEEEYLVSGTAGEWSYDSAGTATTRTADVPYVTRVLVRRPLDAARASGAVQLEPLHPNLDSALSWHSLHDWILRKGHSWVGVTQDAPVSEQLRTRFGDRYGALSIPLAGLGYDILGDVAIAARSGHLPGVAADRVILSGWSATGSFCRVYLQDGFHDRHRLPDGTPAVSGIAIGISSGAAGQAGYPPLSAGCAPLPAADPRRTVHGGETPVFEILSELESETHGASLRPDADETDDHYRLYQVAGTSHTTGREGLLTNGAQFELSGEALPDRRTNEPPSDARLDYVACALFELLDRWITDGTTPPRASRFTFAEDAREPGDAVQLTRDSFGNVVGGIRPPWVDVPLVAYAPHSTPAPGSCLAPAWTPLGTPEIVASLIGSSTPFSEATLQSLYDSRQNYLDRFAASAATIVHETFLLQEEADALITRSHSSWPA